MTLRFHLLGPAQISREGDPIDLPGRRPLALLAYLLVTGVAHSRPHLVDLLFEGPDDPRAALRWSLTKLRGAIGANYILADRGEVAFNFESDYWLDVTAFEAGQTELYRGDFLEGLHVRDAYRFEDWVFFERERLRGRYQEALAGRLEACEDRRNYLAVVEIGHQLLRLDNLREDWYRALMQAYARLGKREAALAQYEHCREVLQTELGVEPIEETSSLATAIERGHILPEAFQINVSSKEKALRPKPAGQQRFPTSLVGRGAEMEALRRVWGRVIERTGQIVLIEGEPGIGKTRLIEQLLAELADQALILRAKCPELENPLAYTLFVDPLREVLSGKRPHGLTDAWLAEVARLLPELCDRYPSLPQPVQLDPDAERRRLFDAVCATLLSLTNEQPLVLLLDDLQWADRTSLELLNHLSDWITEAPVLTIGAYRPHEVGVEHPLQINRRAWKRAGLLTGLSLGPLSKAAMDDLLQQLTTWTGEDPSFGDLIYQEAGGNPLFALEVVANLRDEGRLPQSAEDWRRDFLSETLSIPLGVRTIIETRLNRLDELSRQVIAAAAVMRGSFAPVVAQAVSGRNELETLESLEHLSAVGLLVELPEDRFTFGHDKIREVAYESLSQLRRRLLHRRVAETLERQHRGREKMVAERLAYHYERAGVLDKALDYHLQAGHRARKQYAHEAAVGHYQKALAYLKDQKDYERAARTLMQLGLTYHTAFEFQKARQAYQEGFALWQRAGDTHSGPAVPLRPAPHALRMLWTNPTTLDPTLSGDLNTSALIEQLFRGLMKLGRDLDVIPDVARTWEVSEGGRKYIFNLRHDVRWSDGIKMTAGDFEYAWKRILDPATGSPVANLLYDVKGARAFHEREGNQKDLGVYAIDDVTLAVELEEPVGYFLHLLAGYATYAVPRHVVEAHGDDWAKVGNIVTSGPFRMDAWWPGESMILERNPGYHDRFTGNVERVELFLSPDRSAELEMYEAGKTDAIGLAAIPSEGMYHARQRQAGEYVTAPHLAIGYADFDVRRPPFDDPRIRRAFVQAVDRETLADVVLRGQLFPATGGFILPGMPGHSAGIGWPHDPEAARQLLAEAGYVGGTGFPSVEILALRGWESMVEYLAAEWHIDLGVKVTWQTMEWATYVEQMERKPRHVCWRVWVADYPDPDNFLRVAVSKYQHVTGWQNAAYNELVEQARRLMDQEERIKLYKQADKILIEEAAVVPLLYGRANLLFKPWVSKYLVPPIGGTPWKNVVINPH